MPRLFLTYPDLFNRVSEVLGAGFSTHTTVTTLLTAVRPGDGVRKDLALAVLSAITHADDLAVSAILTSLSTALRDNPKESLTGAFVELTAHSLGKHPIVAHSGGTWWSSPGSWRANYFAR